jgi:NADPH-dependent 2,4-dienoyl-CoA reductase/sulfur reductase-like enzyme
MNRFELVIAGGGLTAARAIKSYRDAGGDGHILLLTAENVLPYHRPALSKGYLRGETGAPFAEDEAFYRDRGVEVLLDAAITAVDVAGGSVVSGRGEFSYRKLLLATGATPRRLKIPGADLAGVCTLRTLHDSDHIRAAAQAAERAVVVGGGFIGMEVASSLRQLGLAVTLIHMGGGLFDQLGCRELSEELLALYRENGVDVLLEEEVARFGGETGIEYVETKSGLCVEADLAVVGVGVVPEVDFLEGSDLAIDDGVLVDERFATEAAGVYAAGDVANFYDPLYGRRRRIEHWSNANYQGAEVGKILAGQGGGYDTVSSFFSEVFGVTIKVFGNTSGTDESSTEGSLGSGFVASFGHRRRLVGAITVGQSEEFETLVKDLIAERAPADALTRALVGGRTR